MNTVPVWLQEEGLQELMAQVRAAGGEARVVGGAVRDFLMARTGGDVDLASSLPPERMMEIAAAQGWKAIPTGIAHGTVTVVLPERVVEVTTLRRDVETDGRHATVVYTDRFEEDAARRDFTMNALYMDAQGTVFDFFGGRNDCMTWHVRFIGEAPLRIAEDGLRILRYFRFLATHGTPPVDPQALFACEQKKQMIGDLSGERIAQEMRKLLAAEDPLYSLRQMEAIGLSPLLTHGAWALEPLERLLGIERAHALEPRAWVRLLAMITPAMRVTQAEWIAQRWRLSRAERQQLDCLAVAALPLNEAQVKEMLRHMPRAWARDRVLLDALDHGCDAGLDAKLAMVHHWPVPQFPVTAKDLLAAGMDAGPALGARLKALEQQWIASDYTLGREALLAQ